jgi:predicted enzyme related to lactoylglutathione lyase
MTNPHGDFIWYELMTSDPDAAAEFYGAVTGWRARMFGAAGSEVHDYRILGTGEADVAGLMTVPKDAACAGMRPCWLGYVGVDDVDAVAADAVASGGRQVVPPTDIPGVGRFAMLTDPQGAAFYVMRGATEGTSTSFAQRTGHCNWNELATSDQEAALAFYCGRFGWEKGDALPMGDRGDYRFINHHGRMLGAMMPRMPDGPPPMWTFYFGVDDIDAATAAASARGATIHHGPTEVPGDCWIIVASDPQGAIFGLVGPRRA